MHTFLTPPKKVCIYTLKFFLEGEHSRLETLITCARHFMNFQGQYSRNHCFIQFLFDFVPAKLFRVHIPIVILAVGAEVCICTITPPLTWIKYCLNAGDIHFFFTVPCLFIKQVAIQTLVYLSTAMRTPIT